MQNPPLSKLAQRLAAPEADVWSIHYDAVARQAAGEDVILMSVGDPDFATPEYIIEQVVDSIHANRTHYSPAQGEPAMLQALAELESNGTGRSFTPENFVVLPGATAGLFATLAAICDPGDEVVVPEPMYIGYVSMEKALNIRLVGVPMDMRAEIGQQVDVDALLAVVTERTRAVLINTPGNPIGNMIPPHLLKRLAGSLAERGIWLISDEVYSLLTFEERHVSLLNCAEELHNIVVIDGLSKSHAMTGWRIGWVCGPPALIKAVCNYTGAAFFGCSQFIQDAAVYALQHNDAHVAAMRKEYRRRRDYLIARLEQMPGFGYIKPQAGMFLMLDTGQVADNGETFARRLLEQQGVSVVPGLGFGKNCDQFVRVSLTHDVQVIGAACDRIAAFVDQP